jgi:phage-related protein
MAQGPASVDENVKVNLLQLQTMKSQLDVVKEFKNSVHDDIKTVSSSMAGLGKGFSGLFSLKSLGSKLGNIFSKGIKKLTTPFKNLGSKISSAFGGLKSKLAGLNPLKGLGGKLSGAFSGLKNKIANFRPISAIKEKAANLVKKPIQGIKTLLGKNDEQLKAKFFRLWSNPKKVAKIWNKESSKTKNLSPAAAKKSAGVSEIGGALLAFTSKLFAQLDKFITKALVKVVAAFHAAIGPYVFLILAAIILGMLLFKDQIKELIPIFGKILNVIADVLESVKGDLGKVLISIAHLISSLLEAYGKLITIIADSVVKLLTSVVTLVTDLLSIVNKVVNLVGDTLIAILQPIHDVVIALKPVFDGIVNLLKKFIDNPIGTAAEVGKNIVGGIKSLVGSAFGSGSKDEKEGESIIEKVFGKITNVFSEVKEFITGGGLLEIIKKGIDVIKEFFTNIFDKVKETVTNLFDKVINSVANMLKTVADHLVASLSNVLTTLSDALFEMLKGINATIMAAAMMSMAGNVINSANAIFSSIKNKIKTGLGMELSPEEKKKAEAQKNPFSLLIEGFEKMHKETVQILTEISKTLVSIERNKIQIGSMVDSSNKGEVADGKKTNAIQSVTINNSTNVDGIIEKMEETNKLLNGILTNTSMDDKGEQKTNAVWSI